MSIFGVIRDTIFGSDIAEGAVPALAGYSEATRAAAPATGASDSATAVEINAHLAQIAVVKGASPSYKTSIVELMRLLNLDSSLGSRIELAKELGYEGDTNDSATMSIWLHDEVMKNLTMHST